MPANSHSRRYERVEFAALTGPINKEIFDTQRATLTLSVPITHTVVIPDAWLEAFWAAPASPQDEAALDALVAGFQTVDLTGETIEQTVPGPVTASSETDVEVLDYTTPPLEAGKYQVSWLSNIRITAPAELTGARAVVVLNGSGSQPTHTDLFVPVAYNGTVNFKVGAGAQIRIQYLLAKVGAGAVDAEASNVRFTIDKIG